MCGSAALRGRLVAVREELEVTPREQIGACIATWCEAVMVM